MHFIIDQVWFVPLFFFFSNNAPKKEKTKEFGVAFVTEANKTTARRVEQKKGRFRGTDSKRGRRRQGTVSAPLLSLFGAGS